MVEIQKYGMLYGVVIYWDAGSGDMKNPNPNLEYRKNSKGRMVIVGKYDPDTMVSFTLTSDTKPTDSQLEMIQKASKKPIVYEDDCPELTPQMIEAFKKAANQRNMKLNKDGKKIPELV